MNSFETNRQKIETHFHGYKLKQFKLHEHSFTSVVKVRREGYNCGGRLALLQVAWDERQMFRRIGVGYKDGQEIVFSDELVFKEKKGM